MDLLAGPVSDEPAAAGDLLVRDRAGNWTYAFCVVVDDARHGVDLVIRGRDLLDATPVQLRLARLLGRETPPQFLHHPLMRRVSGQKLSKAEGDTAVRSMLDDGRTPAELFGRAARLAGLQADETPIDPRDLACLFRPPDDVGRPAIAARLGRGAGERVARTRAHVIVRAPGAQGAAERAPGPGSTRPRRTARDGGSGRAPCAPAAAAEVRDERAGGGLVEVLGRLVEDEDAHVRQEGSGEREPLALATERRAPCSPTCVVEPVREGCGPSPSSPAAASAGSSIASVAPGRARRRLSASVASKMCGSCSHRPTRSGRRRPGSSGCRPSRPARQAPSTRPPDPGSAGTPPRTCSCRRRWGRSPRRGRRPATSRSSPASAVRAAPG